jgi:hypothetical protein
MCCFLFLFSLFCQSKNLAVSGGGQVVLLAYLSTLTFNRLTTFISLFSTTQPLNFDNGHHEPLINLGWAIIVFGLMISGNTPLCLKRAYSTYISNKDLFLFLCSRSFNSVLGIPFFFGSK